MKAMMVRPVNLLSTACKFTAGADAVALGELHAGRKLHGAADEECIAIDEESIWTLTLNGGKGRIDLAAGAGLENLDLQPDGGGGLLHDP